MKATVVNFILPDPSLRYCSPYIRTLFFIPASVFPKLRNKILQKGFIGKLAGLGQSHTSHERGWIFLETFLRVAKTEELVTRMSLSR